MFSKFSYWGSTQSVRLFLPPETLLLLMNICRTETPLCSWRNNAGNSDGGGGGGREWMGPLRSVFIHPHLFDVCLTDPLRLSDIPPVISPFYVAWPLSHTHPKPINPAPLRTLPGVNVSFLYFFYKWQHNKRGLIFYISHVSRCLYCHPLR